MANSDLTRLQLKGSGVRVTPSLHWSGNEVIGEFNRAFAEGMFEPTKDLLEELNEQGCSLN